MGKMLIVIGIVLIVAGLFIQFPDKVRFFGRLPGDIVIEKENFKFYFPVMSCILISMLLTLLWYLFNRFKS